MTIHEKDRGEEIDSFPEAEGRRDPFGEIGRPFTFVLREPVRVRHVAVWPSVHPGRPGRVLSPALGSRRSRPHPDHAHRSRPGGGLFLECPGTGRHRGRGDRRGSPGRPEEGGGRHPPLRRPDRPQDQDLSRTIFDILHGSFRNRGPLSGFRTVRDFAVKETGEEGGVPWRHRTGSVTLLS